MKLMRTDAIFSFDEDVVVNTAEVLFFVDDHYFFNYFLLRQSQIPERDSFKFFSKKTDITITVDEDVVVNTAEVLVFVDDHFFKSS